MWTRKTPLKQKKLQKLLRWARWSQEMENDLKFLLKTKEICYFDAKPL